MRMRSWLRCALVASSALIAACSGGTIGDPQAGGPSYGEPSSWERPGLPTSMGAEPSVPGKTGPSPNGAPGVGTTPTATVFEPAPATLRRLTVEQYRKNNLLKTEVSSKDVAELAAEMCGPLFAKTTAAQVPVDGGNDRVV